MYCIESRNAMDWSGVFCFTLAWKQYSPAQQTVHGRFLGLLAGEMRFTWGISHPARHRCVHAWPVIDWGTMTWWDYLVARTAVRLGREPDGKDVAAVTGMSESQISNWHRGMAPELQSRTARKIAKNLGVPLSEVYAASLGELGKLSDLPVRADLPHI